LETLKKCDYLMDTGLPFSIFRHRHNRDNAPRIHSHEFVELIYVVSGEAVHRFGDEQYPLRSGDIVIINPSESHTFEIEPGKEIEIINCLFMHDVILDTCLRELGVSETTDYYYVLPFLDRSERFHHCLSLNLIEAARVLHLLEFMLSEWTEKSSGFVTTIRVKLVELFLLLSRLYSRSTGNQTGGYQPYSANEQLAQRITDFLEHHFEEKLCVASISKQFNISTRQLNRIYRQITGMSILEQIHQNRIERAKRYLLESDDKVIQIAHKVGYDDSAFFSHLFHRCVGCSPRAYRRLVR
jgi:AraC-like DNA-binding protein